MCERERERGKKDHVSTKSEMLIKASRIGAQMVLPSLPACRYIHAGRTTTVLLGIPGFHICDLTRHTAHPGQAEEQAGKRGVLRHRAVHKNPVTG